MAVKEDIIFNAKFDDALKSLNKFSSSAKSAFNALSIVAGAAVAIFAGKKVIDGFGAAIEAASDQEKSLQKLNTALALSGEYSDQASKHFDDFANKLEKATNFTGDAILSGVALAKTFGTTNDQAERLVRAATDLASATGVSLDSAIQQLGQTLQGTSSTLGRTIPGIKNLSVESLKAGGAITVIEKRLGGAASENAKTFSGSIEALSISFGKFLEEIGNVIVKNPVIIAVFQELSKIIGSVSQALAESAPSIKDFIGNLIKGFLNTIPSVISVFQGLGNAVLFFREILLKMALGVTSALSALLEFSIVRKVIAADIKIITTYLSSMLQGFTFLVEGFAKLSGTTKYLNPVTDSINGLAETLDNIDATAATDSIANGVENISLAIATAVDDSDILYKSFNDGAESAKKSAQGFADKIGSIDANAKKSTASLEKLNAAAKDNGSKKPPFDLKAFSSDLTKYISDGFLGGASSLLDAIQSLIDFVPGLLDKATKIFTSLTDLPDRLVNSVNGLFDAATSFVEKFIPNLARSIPKLINSALTFLIKGLPKAVNALVKELPTIVSELISYISDGLPEIFSELVAGLPDLINEFINGVIEALPRIITALIDNFLNQGGVVKIVTALINNMPQIALALVKGVLNLISGGIFNKVFSGFGSIFSSAIKFPKFDIGNLRSYFDGSRFASIFNGFKSYLNGSKFVEAIKQAFKKIIEDIKKALTLGIGGGGGGGGTFGSIKKRIGLAKGGQVNEVPSGFGNDTFPARLTSGELIVDRSTASMLRDFLDNNGTTGGQNISELVSAINKSSEKNVTVNISVSEQQLAKVLLNLNRQGFKTA